METLKRSVKTRGREKRKKRIDRAQKVFRVVKILYDIIIMDRGHCTFVQSLRTQNTKN